MPNNSNLLLIFLTGLTTGGLTCLALQGGLLATLVANQKKQGLPSALPISVFLASKVLTHTLLGGILGLLGATFAIPPQLRGWLQVVIAVYVFGVAANLLELHPIFRYFIITPPKFLSRLVKDESKSRSFFAPALLGAFTIFIPCATTQAMEVLAISSASPFYAALILLSFTLGTIPSFVFFGFLLHSSSNIFQKYFPKVAATALFLMSIYSLNGALTLFGSIYTIQNFIEAATTTPDPNQAVLSATISNNVQEVNLTATSRGYSPNNITLKKGIKTRLIINSQNLQSCASSFVIPRLGIQKLLPVNGQTVLEFTPNQTGPLVYSCSMGMYSGQFQVI